MGKKNTYTEYSYTLKEVDDIEKGYESIISDLEAKLAESEQQCQECKHLNKKIELNIKNKLMNEIQQLKQQLAEKDQAIEGLQEINQSLGQTCNNDAKEIERLREKLAELIEQKQKELTIKEIIIQLMQNDSDNCEVKFKSGDLEFTLDIIITKIVKGDVVEYDANEEDTDV